MDESYWMQHRIKKQNQTMILRFLAESEGLAFNELMRKTGLSPMGLTKHLKELEEKNLIQLNIQNRKRVYQLKNKAKMEKAVAEWLQTEFGLMATAMLVEAYRKGEKQITIKDIDKYVVNFLNRVKMPTEPSFIEKIFDEIVI